MSTQVLQLTKNLYRYLLSVGVRDSEILRELREENAQHPRAVMQIAPEQGQFMALLVQLLGAKKVLEVGAFAGHGALAVALAPPPEGKVVACNVSDATSGLNGKRSRNEVPHHRRNWTHRKPPHSSVAQ